MVLKKFFANDLKTQKEFKELKSHISMFDIKSERDIMNIWRSIKHMRSELNIPSHIPMEDIIELFDALEEIRTAFDLQNINFAPLNELYIEITTVRNMLGVPRNISLPELLTLIDPDQLPTLGLGKHSLLEKVLKFYILK